MTNRSPSLAKWPFILADVLLLIVCAWVITQVLPNRTTGAYVVAAMAIIAWMGGAILCVWPWIVEFKAESQNTQNETLGNALKQIERLEEIGERVQSATASWQSAQDSAMRVTTVAKEIEERIKTDSKDFMEFAERINTDEKQHLRLEVEKLRRSEGEWLQVAARMLDHTFALASAAMRSGQPNLVTQMTNFQTACRDAARRVGLVAFHPGVGEAYDERSQQLEDANAKPEEGAVVSEILATGYSFQGQLLRKALVRVSKPQAETPTESPAQEQASIAEPEPVSEQQPQTEVADQVEEAHEQHHTHPEGEEISEAAENEIADSTLVEDSLAEEPVVEVEPATDEETDGVLNEFAASDSAAAEPNASATSAAEVQEEEKPRRRQRKADPQTSLPF